MRQIFNIARRELAVNLRRPTFWLGTILVPLVTGALFLGSTLLTGLFVSGDEESNPFAAAARPSGFVDQAGVVREVPLELHARLIPFEDTATARDALENDRIGSYFVIEADYLRTGRVTHVSRQTSIVSGADTQRIDALLRANLSDDERLARRLADTINVHREVTPGPDGQPAPTAGSNPLASRGIALALAMVLALSILNGGGSLVQAIAEEKENRTIEVVLTSVRPLQFMAGKLIGLGLMALVQLGVWMLLGSGAIGFGGAALAGAIGEVQPGIAFWLVVYFVLGYLFYGGLLAAAGAVGATARESGQVTGVLVIPLFLPLMLNQALTEGTGSVGVALTLIPFTAPVTAIMELAGDGMPAWQLGLSVLMMVIGVAFALWLAARLFRATTLLSGVRPTPRALWRAVRG